MNESHTPTSPGRRRLAKGGLAAPVVLASLTTKNAFAQALPQSCFVSGGMLSGNLSPRGGGDTDLSTSCSLPMKRDLVQMRLKEDPTTFSSAFGVNIYVAENGKLTKAATSGNKPLANATLFQVLTFDSVTDGDPVLNLFTLKQAIVIRQNAVNFPQPSGVVPLSEAQVVGLANVAFNNTGSFDITTSIGTKTFDVALVQQYFNTLSA